MYTDDELQKIHKWSNNNRAALEASTEAGCFYCLEIYKPKQVKDWCLVNNINTNPDCAICPYCGIDSVLPSVNVNITKQLLRVMKDKYFGRSRKK